MCLAEFFLQPTKLPLRNLIDSITTHFDTLWPGAEVKVRKISEVGRAAERSLNEAARRFVMALGALSWNDNPVNRAGYLSAVPPLLSKIADEWEVIDCRFYVVLPGAGFPQVGEMEGLAARE